VHNTIPDVQLNTWYLDNGKIVETLNDMNRTVHRQQTCAEPPSVAAQVVDHQRRRRDRPTVPVRDVDKVQDVR
jgi:hypothetical protein